MYSISFKKLLINWSLIFKRNPIIKAPIFVETQAASFLHYISEKGCYRKNNNSFGISRASVSLTIWCVSYSIVKYLSSDYIKLLKSPEELKHFTFMFHESHGFPYCLATIDKTKKEIIELPHYYTDYLNRKGYTLISFPYGNHWKCYKKTCIKIVAQAIYSCLLFSYTYTLLFCWKIELLWLQFSSANWTTDQCSIIFIISLF